MKVYFHIITFKILLSHKDSMSCSHKQKNPFREVVSHPKTIKSEISYLPPIQS